MNNEETKKAKEKQELEKVWQVGNISISGSREEREEILRGRFWQYKSKIAKQEEIIAGSLETIHIAKAKLNRYNEQLDALVSCADKYRVEINEQ